MAISKTGIRRLYRLCEYMESLPKSAGKHFDMNSYFEHAGIGHEHKMPTTPSVKDLHACGTTACALGWAVTVPHFRKSGLKVRPFGSFYTVAMSAPVFGLGVSDEDHDEEKWEQLFGCDNEDKSPKSWAKRVRKLLKKWETAQATE